MFSLPQNKSIKELFDEILNEAEKLYGRRDVSIILDKITIHEKDYPEIVPSGDTNVTIYLTKECKENLTFASYQLSHEIIHFLKPSFFSGSSANYLEEGVAVYFSINFTKSNYGEINISNPNYKKANDLVVELLSYDENIIFRLRKLKESLSLITSEDILSICPLIPKKLTDEVCEKFPN